MRLADFILANRAAILKEWEEFAKSCSPASGSMGLVALSDHASEMLTVITNDAWYGESSAAYQHFEMATMRAIEQGRYLVRAANTGITGIVDAADACWADGAPCGT